MSNINSIRVLCLLETVAKENYGEFLTAIADAKKDDWSPSERARRLNDIADAYPEYCFRQTSHGVYMVSPGLLRSEKPYILLDLPGLEHPCCGMALGSEDSKVKIHTVKGLEFIAFDSDTGACITVGNWGNGFRCSFSRGAADIFVSTQQQGFMKLYESMNFFDKHRKAARVAQRRPQPSAQPSFVNDALKIG